MEEPLDFCRVKKIDEKGFGFLKSLYYPNDIFFHFSQIKKEDYLEKLNAMKRGDFFLYFISKLQLNGKRKAIKIWYSLETVPQELIQMFIEKLIIEFNFGKTNIYDLIYAFNELKKNDLLPENKLFEILNSKRILHLPTTIVQHLDKNEIKLFKKILKFDELKDLQEKPYWFEDINNL